MPFPFLDKDLRQGRLSFYIGIWGVGYFLNYKYSFLRIQRHKSFFISGMLKVQNYYGVKQRI